MNPFNADKVELLIEYLGSKGAQIRHHAGRQQVRCINGLVHTHGDRNPSASVDLVKGTYKCFACGLQGDVFDLALELDGIKATDLVAGKDIPTGEEDVWIL